jgi:EmrB/QacA subfamily drug resistance transporter
MLVVGMFMSILDVTIVNVAIPAIQKDFGGGLEDVLWVATAYTLTLGVVVPVTSWLGDRFGLTNLYIGSLLGFAACSALCGLAWNLDILVIARVLQAIPGGILPVVTLTMLYRIVPERQIGTAMGMYGLGAIVAPAIGPVLGGYLVEYLNWRLVFYINAPVGVLGAVASYFLVPKLRKTRTQRFDFVGFIAIALGLFAILLAASEGESWGWTGYRILMLLTFGALALATFVVIELQVEHPLIEIRLFKIGQFALPVLLIGLLFINLLSGAFYIPVFLQQGQSMGAFDAGLLILPQAIAMCLVMPVSGLLYDKIGPRWLAVAGMLVTAYGTHLMCAINADMTRMDLIIWTSVRAAGMGLAIMPMMTASIDAVPPAFTNQGSAILNVVQQVAGALGLATLGALAAGQQAQLLADRGALTSPSSSFASDSGSISASTFATVYRLVERLQAQVLAVSYANMFLLLTFVTLGCSLSALFLRSAPVKAGSDRADSERAESEGRTSDRGATDAAASVQAVVTEPVPVPEDEGELVAAEIRGGR